MTSVQWSKGIFKVPIQFKAKADGELSVILFEECAEMLVGISGSAITVVDFNKLLEMSSSSDLFKIFSAAQTEFNRRTARQFEKANI